MSSEFSYVHDKVVEIVQNFLNFLSQQSMFIRHLPGIHPLDNSVTVSTLMAKLSCLTSRVVVWLRTFVEGVVLSWDGHADVQAVDER